MAWFDWLFEKHWVNIDVKDKVEDLKAEAASVEHGISLYANLISKCEIKKYKPSKNGSVEIKDEIYYTLNVRPNKNKNATEFWNSVITTLFNDGEALIISQGQELYLADSFKIHSKTFIESTFDSIVVDEYKVSGVYSMKDVLYLSLNNSTVRDSVKALYKKMGNFVNETYNDYLQSSGRKLVYTTKGNFNRRLLKSPTDEETNQADKYVTDMFTKVFENANAVVKLQQDEKIEEIGTPKDKSPNRIDESLDALDRRVALSMNIPYDVFVGKISEKSSAINDFITFGIGTIIELINDELNAKLISKTNFNKGYRYKMDSTQIKHRDIFDTAVAIEKLYGIGYTHNELREKLGDVKVDDEKANERHWSANFTTQQKGGEESE